MRVRKKPLVVEAAQAAEAGVVATAHGPAPVDAGDWIVVDPTTGDTWPVKAAIFEATYEVLEPAAEIVVPLD